MRHMDAAMKVVVSSSLILSTTPSGTSGATISIIVPSFVPLLAGIHGQYKRFSFLSPCPLLSSFRIRDARLTHDFLAAISDSTLRSTYRTISNTVGN
jgi:hypothetical protein